MASATDPTTWGDLAELAVILLVPTSILLVVRYLNRHDPVNSEDLSAMGSSR